MMDVSEAWAALGEDPEIVMAELMVHPDVPSRIKAAEAALVRAERIGKALLSIHHPDRNPGDQAAVGRFRRVINALEAIRYHTAELKKRASETPEDKKGPIIAIR